MTTTATTTSHATLRRHGKSFHWAGFFLPRQQLNDGARLYHVCRQVDDIADHAVSTPERQRARKVLCCLQSRLKAHLPALGSQPLTNKGLTDADRQLVDALEADIVALFEQDARCLYAMQALVATMVMDLSPLHLPDEPALLDYAHGAAGTVGVMMCQLMNARDPDHSLAFAIDLGIAMQMTNIARDVLEDAQRGRLYLPQTWMSDNVTADAIVRGTPHARDEAWQATRYLVARAEDYYASGWQGLAYLPTRSRLAIGIALRVYRQIGRRIVSLNAPDYWAQRVVVPTPGKMLQSVLALPTLIHTSPARHDQTLHQGLEKTLAAYALAPRTLADKPQSSAGESAP
ncbi:phytoene/squalene synthase family protein [Halomonas vilamensis]|uniref:Phytoene/squalene synthase family protein n=1 Tax=Vreelandella vilamensis TaxID=531309 RepID=A0ABU1H0L7_9GAMM|nr:phytoene/squalene synthase family protein [Halomonas vilamensis]MDR5897851.1 phytoene/squalene synthase family protein [Halomonas vilamensis]